MIPVLLRSFFFHRRRIFLGYLLSFGVFTLFNLFLLVLRYENHPLIVLKVPFALLLPSWWSGNWDVLRINMLITLFPLTAVGFALYRYRSQTLVAISHCSLVLYWAHVFLSVMP